MTSPDPGADAALQLSPKAHLARHTKRLKALTIQQLEDRGVTGIGTLVVSMAFLRSRLLP